MAQNITYLIGAGASYNALPVVSNWNKRLGDFIKYLKESKQFIKKGVLSDESIDGIIYEIEIIFPEAKKHATIDTYAKKLFLRAAEGDDKKLLSLKHFLGCFFSFEQIKESRGVAQKGGGYKDIGEVYEGKKVQVDPRYDVFFATLLNPETKSLDERVNIISWNYDLQLEMAYSDFYGNFNPQLELKIFPNAYDKVLNKGEKFQTIKLNGTAGLVHTKKGCSPIVQYLKGGYFPKIKGEKISFQEPNEFSVPSLETMLGVYSRFLQGDPSIEPSIDFAWEESHTPSDKLKYAKELMATTETLVVIGYSFPNFNRKIDKALLEALPHNRKVKIYYQDDEKRVHGLIQRLKGILPSRFKNNEFDIEPYTDLDQFFIPYEL